MQEEKSDWSFALSQVYNCYTIIKDTEELAAKYKTKAEKCNIIALMLENSTKGKNQFVLKISDSSLIKELQSTGVKVDLYNNYGDYQIRWSPDDLMKFISIKN